MVFDRFLKMFNQQTTAKPQPPGAQKASALPHPEEPMNPQANLANTSPQLVMSQWLTDWGVPEAYWNHWKGAIDLQVYDVYPPQIIAMGINQGTPAATWEAEGKRHLAIKTQWLNPGVIAHEQAHNSYAYLNAGQKTAFSALYRTLINTDPLIQLLYSINKYGLNSDVEGHAEVYRYIGQHMPAQLKPFYPALF